MPRNLACELVGEALVVVQNAHPPRDDEWDGYLRAIELAATELHRDYDRLRHVVFSDGGAPDGAQRDRLLAITGRRSDSVNSRVALISASALTRGVVTVLSWFGVSVIAFAPARIEAALDYVRVPAEDAPRIRDAAERLGATLDGGVPLAVSLCWRERG